MKKRIFIPVLTLFAGVTASWGGTVTAEKALEIANNFMPQSRLVPVTQTAVKTQSLNAVSATPTVYCFNAEGGGYVIVNAKDGQPSVLGYSLEGHLDLDNLPDGMKALLEMNSLLSDQAAEPMNLAAGPGTPVVSPLLGGIMWGQDDPFNAMCPTDASGKPYYVGCVATAATQIMRYYSYPTRGTGSKSYQMAGKTLTADFGNTVYDWANMPESVSGTPTVVQKNALATLAYHFGVAVEMTYETGGSAATTMMVPGALRNYFGYSPSACMRPRSYYNTDEWMAMIKGELDKGRPVYYAASSDSGSGGHAFVCDGYDSNDYVHINWGWTGKSNGYFLISHLNPSSLGIGGGTGGYNLNQEIITDFVPSTSQATYPVEPAVYEYTRFSSDIFGSTLSIYTYLANYDVTPFAGNVAAVLCRDGRIVKVLKEQAFSINGYTPKGAYQEYLRMNDIPAAAGVANGIYRLQLAYKGGEMPDYKILRHTIGSPSYAEVRVDNGIIVSHTKASPAPEVVLTEALEPVAEIHANSAATFTARLRNDSYDFRLANIVLRFESVDDKNVCAESENLVNIYDRSEEAVKLNIVLPATVKEGLYEVTVYEKGYSEAVFNDSEVGRCRVEVLPAVDHPILMMTQSAFWADTETYATGGTATVAFEVQNFGAQGKGQMNVRLQDVSRPEKQYLFRQVAVTSNVNQVSQLNTGSMLYVGAGEYRPVFTYVDNRLGEHDASGLYGPGDAFTVATNPNLLVEVVECDFPTYLEPRTRISASVKVRALQTFSNATFYFRLRPFTLTDGELAYMEYRLGMTAGEERTIKFNYTPGASLAQTLYVPLIEVKNASGTTLPAGNYDAYYREIGLGVEAGVNDVLTDQGQRAWTFDGDSIGCTDPEAEIRLYGLSGVMLAQGRGSLGVGSLGHGVFVVEIVSPKGVTTHAKIKF